MKVKSTTAAGAKKMSLIGRREMMRNDFCISVTSYTRPSFFKGGPAMLMTSWI